jgi:hypothetical protein
MPQTKHTPEEIADLAEQIYRRDIRPKVMPQHKGKFLVLDIKTGQYEIDEDDFAAWHRLCARVPDGEYFAIRIGYTTANTLGGTMEEETA